MKWNWTCMRVTIGMIWFFWCDVIHYWLDSINQCGKIDFCLCFVVVLSKSVCLQIMNESDSVTPENYINLQWIRLTKFIWAEFIFTCCNWLNAVSVWGGPMRCAESADDSLYRRRLVVSKWHFTSANEKQVFGDVNRKQLTLFLCLFTLYIIK